MYPYGDTRYDTRPAPDEADERAARWTLRALAGAVFVVVLAATLLLSLRALHDLPSPPAPAETPDVQATPTTVATLVTDLGPQPGVDVPGYVQNRRAALAATHDERIAVVSLAKYATEAQARALVGTLPVVALLVAPPGVGPAAVTGDLATWAKAQVASTQSDQDEIKKLIPTVDDPAFKSFYQSEVDRLGKAINNFNPTGPIVFGLVVRGGAAPLQALGARPEVRMVDVGDFAQADPKATFRSLRPEEVAKANDPPLRPL